MVIRLPESLDRAPAPTPPEELTPRQIVAELDKYIVGQDAAKRAVAIAIRNRQRRLKLPPDLAEEVAPKNILMIGPTGVGKTEICRRLSRLTGSPFVKVEATKFTEVGYVGRDVESMVRDLVEIAVSEVRREHLEGVRGRARRQAEDRVLDLLAPPLRRAPMGSEVEAAGRAEQRAAREKLRSQLREGLLDDRTVEVEVRDSRFPSFQIFTGHGVEQMDINVREMFPGLFGGQVKRRRMRVPEALEHLEREAADALVDEEEVAREARRRAESSGIIFIDEIDKIAGRLEGHGPDVSREGVQRDLLPIVEGTVVNTRYGMVQTNHILFLAAGAFHATKPSDLIPELQGRFPLRVELDPLGREELARILTEPENSLVRQYVALMRTEGVELRFTEDAVATIADYAATVNERTENIGARRLHTIIERVLDEISFNAPERAGQQHVIDGDYVRDALKDLVADEDLSKYIL